MSRLNRRVGHYNTKQIVLIAIYVAQQIREQDHSLSIAIQYCTLEFVQYEQYSSMDCKTVICLIYKENKIQEKVNVKVGEYN